MSETAHFLEILRLDGRIRDTQARLVPLQGGVSSEIYLVEDGGRKFVVKRALAKLKVKDNWFADVTRNANEKNYFECVGRIVPDAVPIIYFSNPDAGYFGMEFFGGEFKLWKELLLAGDCRPAHARLAGNILGEIHHRTSDRDSLRKQFDTTAMFRQLRTEPYLLTTGERHPELQETFVNETRRLESTSEALVHGDFSPKNILICADRMVLLDSEAAWYGDPAFDVAFLLNHLFLKSLHHAPKDFGIENMVTTFWQTYLKARPNSPVQPVSHRIVPLLLMLLLARVDGKSPVEYLKVPKQQFVRDFVHKYLPSPPTSLTEMTGIWFAELLNTGSHLEAS